MTQFFLSFSSYARAYPGFHKNSICFLFLLEPQTPHHHRHIANTTPMLQCCHPGKKKVIFISSSSCWCWYSCYCSPGASEGRWIWNYEIWELFLLFNFFSILSLRLRATGPLRHCVIIDKFMFYLSILPLLGWKRTIIASQNQNLILFRFQGYYSRWTNIWNGNFPFFAFLVFWVISVCCCWSHFNFSESAVEPVSRLNTHRSVLEFSLHFELFFFLFCFFPPLTTTLPARVHVYTASN